MGALTTPPRSKGSKTQKTTAAGSRVMSSAPPTAASSAASRAAAIERKRVRDAARKAKQDADPELQHQKEIDAAKQKNQDKGAAYDYQSPEQAVASGQAVQQQTADLQAKYDRVNQTGAMGGTSEWTQNADGSWSKKTSLSADQQSQLDAQNKVSTTGKQAAAGLAGSAAASYQQPFSLAGTRQVANGQNVDDWTKTATQKAFDAQFSLLAPGQEQQMASFEQKAAERGWVPGSKIYEDQKKNLMNQQYSEKQNLANSAYNTGVATGNTQFGQTQQMHQGDVSDYTTTRDRPIQEVASLGGMGGAITQDQFTDPNGGHVAVGSVDDSAKTAGYVLDSQASKYGADQGVNVAGINAQSQYSTQGSPDSRAQAEQNQKQDDVENDRIPGRKKDGTYSTAGGTLDPNTGRPVGG